MRDNITITERILEYICETYKAEPEYLWLSTPENAALRNQRNGKWFGVLLQRLPLSKLGLDSHIKADVLNLKCDPVWSFSLVDREGIFQGYHMNKEHWISVRLDGTVALDQLKMLVDMSFELVDSKVKNPGKQENKEGI